MEPHDAASFLAYTFDEVEDFLVEKGIPHSYVSVFVGMLVGEQLYGRGGLLLLFVVWERKARPEQIFSSSDSSL